MASTSKALPGPSRYPPSASSPPSNALPIAGEVNSISTTERVLVAATPIVTLGALVGLGFPPYAALTRWRACHQPKGIDTAQQLSYWKVLKRVKEKEGTRGLYKGLLTNLSVGIAPWSTVLIGYGLLRVFPRAAPRLLIGAYAQIGWQAVTTLITLPFEILAARVLTIPHRVPIISPLTNLRLLLTADERSHPFKSLWTPSRFIASFAPTLLAPFSAMFLLPALLRNFDENNALVAFLLSQIAIAGLIRTPLAVLAARLNAQRTGGTGAAIVHQKGEESAALEGIVQIRPTAYANIWDAAKTMVAEEGWYSLWRGWPLEVLLAIRNHL